MHGNRCSAVWFLLLHDVPSLTMTQQVMASSNSPLAKRKGVHLRQKYTLSQATTYTA